VRGANGVFAAGGIASVMNHAINRG
jgi:hypothetical protein